MRTKRVLAAVLGASLSTVALAGCGMQGMEMSDSGSSTTSPPSSAAASADFNMQDVMFAQMMIVHHTQAIEMAELVLAKEDIDPQVTEIAESVRSAQQPEIDEMNSWLEDWGMADQEMGDMSGMDGMDDMEEMDMAALEDATGAEASRLFLEQMTVHHEGAVGMAQTQVASGQNAEAVALAEQVITDQQAEIERMQEILDTL